MKSPFNDPTQLAHFAVEFACGAVATWFGGWPAGVAVLVAVLAQVSWVGVLEFRKRGGA